MAQSPDAILQRAIHFEETIRQIREIVKIELLKLQPLQLLDVFPMLPNFYTKDRDIKGSLPCVEHYNFCHEDVKDGPPSTKNQCPECLIQRQS